MSKFWLVLVGIILSLIIVIVSGYFIFRWYYYNQDDVTPFNKNMQFIGAEKLSYFYGKTLLNEDGTMLVASYLHSTPMYLPQRNYLSLIKLDKAAKPLWEKKISFHRTNWRDFVPFLPRQLKSSQMLLVKDISFTGGQYKVLLTRRNGVLNEPFILSIDPEGKLLGSQKVMLDIASGTEVKAISVKDWFYICYIDKVNKLLCLAKTSQTSGEVSFNAMKSFKSDSLMVKTLAADSTGEEFSIVAYDSKVGTSFFRYDKLNDLKEYFRTKPQTEIPSLQTLNNKIFGVVKDDSLLLLNDLTNVGKPLINGTFQPKFKDFTPRAMQIVDGNYYVLLNFTNPDKAYGQDVMVLRFNPQGIKTGEFLIQGKRLEQAHQLVATPDKQLYVFGNSLSVKMNKGVRIFVSKVKM